MLLIELEDDDNVAGDEDDESVDRCNEKKGSELIETLEYKAEGVKLRIVLIMFEE